MHAFELPVFRNFQIEFPSSIRGRCLNTVYNYIAINYMALQISHQVYLSLLWVFKERKKNWDLKTIEQNLISEKPPLSCPCFLWRAVHFTNIILTMEKAMPDAYWILTATANRLTIKYKT
jgi:hypothetical protein